MRKTLGKFVDIGNPIQNTFHYFNFFQFSTDLNYSKDSKLRLV
jgi:hypothetical protein